MSIPAKIAKDTATRLLSGRSQNLSAQSDARHILQEVNELEENYPQFDTLLTEKATHIAYALIACGCSIIENDDAKGDDYTYGLSLLEKAGAILFDTYGQNKTEEFSKDYNLLIAGMSLYASKQFSRAYIAIKHIGVDFVAGQIISDFIRKDFRSLVSNINRAWFSACSDETDLRVLDEWVIAHEIARCFMMLMDFVFSGNSDAFLRIDELLSELLAIAAEDILTLYWLIVRLLKILFTSYENASLWTLLPPLLPMDALTDEYIRLLGSFRSPITELWTSQIDALNTALGNNTGAVINLRTSAGKTRVAELAILQSLMKNADSKALYLAPFRSLAFEIEDNLSKVFSPLGYTVTHLYGSASVNPSDFEMLASSNIIIATPEKAKALIRCDPAIADGLNVIIIDEGHLLGANERNIRNESFINHIKDFATKNQIRVVLLSAVLPNADELAEWITGDSSLVAKSEWKPSLERTGLLLWDGEDVRLEWNSDGSPFNPNFIRKHPLGFGRRRNGFPNDKTEAVAATAVRLANSGTVMIFSAKANSITNIAGAVLLAMGENPEDYPWDVTPWELFESVCIEELESDSIILRAARKGVICHNNRLPTQVRIAMEHLMRSKQPLIIIASTTLGQGVNVGISTVIVSTPYYSDESISNADFWNVCGRAGRAYSDYEGKILYAIDISKKQKSWQINRNRKLANQYFNKNRIGKAKSGILFAISAIHSIARKAGVDFESLIEIVANDTVQTSLPEEASRDISFIFELFDDELLSMHEDFSDDDDTLDWADDLLRNSLAIIQVEHEQGKLEYISLLKARITGLIRRFPNRDFRKRLISTSIPLSVSQAMLNDVDYFKRLAEQYCIEAESTPNKVAILSQYIKLVEDWVFSHADFLIEDQVNQTLLEKIRIDWLGGTALKIIADIDKNAEKATKEFYGYTLPWLLNAIAQMFDPFFEEQLRRVYSTFAMLVEIGLPSEVAANIYLAGVRSRQVSLELSLLELMKEQNSNGIRAALSKLASLDSGVTDEAKMWVRSLSKAFEEQGFATISFTPFTIKRDIPVEKLYIREINGNISLISFDGGVDIPVRPTEELPFDKLANRLDVFFEKVNGIWNLASYDPRIKVSH